MTYEALLSEALRLPPEDRERLRSQLDLSLDADREGEAFELSPAQEKLLQERIAQFEANPDDVIPFDEAMRQIRERLQQRRSERERR